MVVLEALLFLGEIFLGICHAVELIIEKPYVAAGLGLLVAAAVLGGVGYAQVGTHEANVASWIGAALCSAAGVGLFAIHLRHGRP